MNREEEQTLFKLVEASKESHGENARETLIALWKLASFYEQHNELDAAYQILMKRYQICVYLGFKWLSNSLFLVVSKVDRTAWIKMRLFSFFI